VSAGGIPIRRNSRWMCIARGWPKRIHTVIEIAGNTVTTWSDPSTDQKEGGESFRGSTAEFKSLFALCNGGKNEC
jgi:hypothetical protein